MEERMLADVLRCALSCSFQHQPFKSKLSKAEILTDLQVLFIQTHVSVFFSKPERSDLGRQGHAPACSKILYLNLIQFELNLEGKATLHTEHRILLGNSDVSRSLCK